MLVTGNTDLPLRSRQRLRRAAADGRLVDLEHRWPLHLVPLISEDWQRHFTGEGDGEMPPVERPHLHSVARQVHGTGRRLRFWATPDRPPVWDQIG